MKKGKGKILIGVIGVLFTLYSVLVFSLSIWGEPVDARLTSYRRELWQQNQSIPNRYTYYFSYEFEVDGKTYSGNGQRVSGPFYAKLSEGQLIRVRYLAVWPYLSQAEERVMDWASVIYLLIGLVLMGVGFRGK